MDTINQFLSEFDPLSSNSRNEFRQIFSLKTYKKGSVIAGYNQTKGKFFLIKEGITCSYLNDEKGKKVIRTLFLPMSVMASLKSIINQPNVNNVNVNFHCLTDCKILIADLDDFLNLVDKHHDISKLYIQILEKSYSELIRRITHLTTLEATERYLHLKKIAPSIENQIPQYQIASYLNITPIQLSRIRKKLSSK
ncbi:Crp/Fnr family transcriptional regulator [Tenacibaculum sp. S7007]|uniref:Crp/Fnr family transcriptional regulator n=1 Tax=Tenacibaculum pelagium TaxID=2759527 RepID=A0A839AR78_9FLAO|nr:Crp/Fnr family transcriptional regulator [Tenacibaculum pelagium]MBA6156644.1 Crp/Fnr family transcriptional regulator [Tenacibaculum pelagium]